MLALTLAFWAAECSWWSYILEHTCLCLETPTAGLVGQQANRMCMACS